MSSSRTVQGQPARLIAPGAVPGVELLVVEGDPYTTGAVCRLSDGSVHTGIDGFRSVASLAGADPVALARLSMLLLEEPGVASTVLIETADGAASPPAVEGRILTYWRTDKTLDNTVRVTVNLDTAAVETALDTTLARDAAAPSDPIERAQQELASDSLDDRMAGVRRLDALGSTAGDAALIDALLQNDRWQVRKEVARRLGQRSSAPEGAVAALSRSLTLDGYAAVRSTAALSLGALGDRGALPALEQAAQEDTDSSVRAMAQVSLSKLR